MGGNNNKKPVPFFWFLKLTQVKTSQRIDLMFKKLVTFWGVVQSRHKAISFMRTFFKHILIKISTVAAQYKSSKIRNLSSKKSKYPSINFSDKNETKRYPQQKFNLFYNCSYKVPISKKKKKKEKIFKYNAKKKKKKKKKKS